MKLKCLFISAIFILSNKLYSQVSSYFNLYDVDIKEVLINSPKKPNSLFFSQNEEYLYAIYSDNSTFSLKKMNSLTGKVEFEKTYYFADFGDLKISANGNKMLVRSKFNPTFPNIPPTVYYYPDITKENTSYKIDLISGQYYYFLENDNFVVAGNKVFDLTTWNFNDAVSIEPENIIAMRLYNKIKPNFQTCYKNEEITGLGYYMSNFSGSYHNAFWIKDINSPGYKRIIYDDPLNETKLQVIALTNLKAAFYLKNSIHILKLEYTPKNFKTFCFPYRDFTQNKNIELSKDQETDLISKLNVQGYIEGRIYYPRRHPINKNVLGKSTELKGIFQVVGYNNGVFTCRYLGNKNNKDTLTSDDFAGDIYSTKTRVLDDQHLNMEGLINQGYVPSDKINKYYRRVDLYFDSKVEECISATPPNSAKKIEINDNSFKGFYSLAFENNLTKKYYKNSSFCYSNNLSILSLLINGNSWANTEIKSSENLAFSIQLKGLKRVNGKYAYSTYFQIQDDLGKQISLSEIKNISNNFEILDIIQEHLPLKVKQGENTSVYYLSFKIEDYNSPENSQVVGVVKLYVNKN